MLSNTTSTRAAEMPAASTISSTHRSLESPVCQQRNREESLRVPYSAAIRILLNVPAGKPYPLRGIHWCPRRASIVTSYRFPIATLRRIQLLPHNQIWLPSEPGRSFCEWSKNWGQHGRSVLLSKRFQLSLNNRLKDNQMSGDTEGDTLYQSPRPDPE